MHDRFSPEEGARTAKAIGLGALLGLLLVFFARRAPDRRRRVRES